MGRSEDLARLREDVQTGHRQRREFVANLRRTVAGLRRKFMDENRATHGAWFGPTRAEKARSASLMREKAQAALLKKEAAEKAASVKKRGKLLKKGRGR